MERYSLTQQCSLFLHRGDLTKMRVDAIVNAANETLLGGGGVDGAIHRAAGPELLQACRELPPLAPGVRCRTADARLTPAFDLPARYVIHTVGPIYESQTVSAPLLRSAYRSCLALAKAEGLASVAFPALSCGAFGYPLASAAELALATCQRHADGLREVYFILFQQEAFRAWSSAAKEIL